MQGDFLVLQWLRLCTSDAGGEASIPGRSHMPKIPHACHVVQLKKQRQAVSFTHTLLLHWALTLNPSDPPDPGCLLVGWAWPAASGAGKLGFRA